MRSKDINNLFKVYGALGFNNRKIYTYYLNSCKKCLDSEYFYTSFSEAVSAASVEALKESEVLENTIFIWIYEISSPDSNLHPIKGFKVCFIAGEEK